MTETDTKAQGGQKDGSVAADPQVRRQRSKRDRTLPEISDDKQISHPWSGAMSNGPWTDEGNDLIVADYFAMQADDLAGKPFNKAASYRQPADRIDRSSKAIEYKHQNISVVLKALGETWLTDLVPAFNFQGPLEHAALVGQHLRPRVPGRNDCHFGHCFCRCFLWPRLGRP